MLSMPNQVCFSEHQQELNLPQHLDTGKQVLKIIHKYVFQNMNSN